MTISNKKLFIDLKYFFSGCHSLVLNYEERVDEFWKNNIVTDHGLPVCIRIPITSCFVVTIPLTQEIIFNIVSYIKKSMSYQYLSVEAYED